MYRTIRSMNGIKINFLLVTYRLSSNASFLTFATDRTRSISFESWFPRPNRQRRFRPKPYTLLASWKSSLTRRRSQKLCPRFPRRLESNQAWLIRIQIGRRGCKNTKWQSACTRVSCLDRKCCYRPRTNTSGLDAKWQSYTRFDIVRIAYRQPDFYVNCREEKEKEKKWKSLVFIIVSKERKRESTCKTLNKFSRDLYANTIKKDSPAVRKICTVEPSRGYSPQ